MRVRWESPLLFAVATLCLALVAWLVAQLVPLVREGVASYRFQRTSGTLLYANHDESRWPTSGGHSRLVARLSLAYAYSAMGGDGRTHHLESSAFDVAMLAGRSSWVTGTPIGWAMADVALRRAPEVTVYFDPARPARAVVDRGLPAEASVLLIAVAGAFGLALGLVRRRREPGTLSGSLGGAGMYLFGGFLLCLGGAVAMGALVGHMLPALVPLGYAVVGALALAVADWRQVKLLSAAVLASGGVVGAVLVVFIGVALLGEEGSGYSAGPAELVTRARHQHPGVRAHAVARLAEQPSPAVLELALERLNDVDPRVRGSAISAVQSLGRADWATAQAIGGLVRRLDDPEPPLAVRAAFALVNLRAHQRRAAISGAVPGALRLLGGDARAQAAGLRVLGLVDEDVTELVPRMASHLASTEREVRLAASQSLGLLGARAAGALPELRAAAQRAEDDRERRHLEGTITNIARARQR